MMGILWGIYSMTDNAKKSKEAEVINTLEDILAELDKHQLLLPALKIVEALEVLADKRDDKLAG